MLHAFITKRLRLKTYEKAQVTDRAATGEEDSMDAHEKQRTEAGLYQYKRMATGSTVQLSCFSVWIASSFGD